MHFGKHKQEDYVSRLIIWFLLPAHTAGLVWMRRSKSKGTGGTGLTHWFLHIHFWYALSFKLVTIYNYITDVIISASGKDTFILQIPTDC